MCYASAVEFSCVHVSMFLFCLNWIFLAGQLKLPFALEWNHFFNVLTAFKKETACISANFGYVLLKECVLCVQNYDDDDYSGRRPGVRPH